MDGARRWRSCRPPLLRWLADHDSWASKQATETRRERTRRVAGVVGDVDIVMYVVYSFVAHVWRSIRVGLVARLT